MADVTKGLEELLHWAHLHDTGGAGGQQLREQVLVLLDAARLDAGELKVARDALQAMVRNTSSLLKQIGNPGRCSGCNAAIWWVTHRNGKPVPYTGVGLNHFADCPARSRFKKEKVTA